MPDYHHPKSGITFFPLTHENKCNLLSPQGYTPMKTILVLLILFSVSIVLPVHTELTETNLENIRQIFREEWEKPIIDHIDPSLAEIETSFDSIHRSLARIQMMLWIATVLVVVAGIVNWWYVLKLWRSR